MKLFSNNNNKIVVDNRLDPRLQSRWDAAVVEFVYEAGVSFEVCQKLDILLHSIWPTGKLRVTVRNARTVSRHVSQKSTSLKVDVYSIIKADSVKNKAFAFTTDLRRSRALDSFMALTCHYINDEFQLVKLVPFILSEDLSTIEMNSEQPAKKKRLDSSFPRNLLRLAGTARRQMLSQS